ncbi:MAG: PorT family protein [Cyclobacteriaceae bacterium]|nr:PorT family protein [Cyclobacteriaceae bacterium]
MKKVFLSFVFVVVASAAFAQVSGGIRLGMNLANQKAEALGVSVSGDSKVGLLGGLYLTANLSDKFAVQPELLYSSMGSKSGDISDAFGYLHIPILLRYNINENFNLHAGPQIGLLLSAESDGQDIKDQFKGTDFGASLGAGVDFGKFNGGLRYYLGFSNISDIDTSGIPGLGDISFKNTSFQIYLGYKLFGGE